MIRRILAGLGLSTITIVVTMAGQFLAVPVFLSLWGDQIYGEWLTLTNLVTSLSVLNLGVQTYVVNILIVHYVRREIQAGTRVLQGALRLYTLLTGLGILILLFLIGWNGLFDYLGITSLHRSDARLILVVYGLFGVSNIFVGLLMSLFRVIEQLPRQLSYGLIERIILLIAPVIVVIVGGSPVEAALTMGLLMAIITTIEIGDITHRSPFEIGLAKTTWKVSMNLIRPSLMFLAVGFLSQIISTGLILIISNSAGATGVVVFTTNLMLTNLFRIILNQGMSVVWPEITATSASSATHANIAGWHRLTLKVGSLFSLIAAGALALFGTTLLGIWTDGQVYVDPVLNVLLAIYLLVHTPALISRVFGLATNHQGDLFRAESIATSIIILLAITLLPVSGVRGAALALMAGQSVGTALIVNLACKWTADSRGRFLAEWAIPGLPTTVAVGVSVLCLWLFVPSLLWQIAGFLAVMIVTSWLAWHTWFVPSERALAVRVLGMFVSRFRQLRTRQTTL